MNIYKLKYSDKETAITDLIAKGVYIESEEGLSYGQGIQAIVEIGLIVLENGTYDEEGNELTAPIYADGYHFDVMSENEIDFGVYDITSLINSSTHTFAGYEKINEVEINEIDLLYES